MTVRPKYRRSDRAEKFIATQRRLLASLSMLPERRKAQRRDRIDRLERGEPVEVAGWELDDRTYRNGIGARWTLYPDGRIERV